MPTMHPTIVVGVDGSADGDRALTWAAEEAASRSWHLHIVNALDLDERSEFTPDSVTLYRIESERLLNASRAKAEVLGIPAMSVQSVDISPAAILVASSRVMQMVVLGSRGLGAFAGMLLGSVSQHVARHASCPVVVVKEPADERSRRIVVGIDGSPASEQAMRFAFEIASRRQAPLAAITGWRYSTGGREGAIRPVSDDVAEQTAAGERLLAEQLAGWADKYPDVDVTREAIPVHPARVLADASDHAQLIVVGSRGRGAFAELLLGSVSQAVLHHARCPVAIVR